MFTFRTDTTLPKPELYRQLQDAAASVTADEPDKVANMANVASLIMMFVPDLNWAGFYRAMGQELVLGPFIGQPACIRIPFGSGVCGTAAATGRAVRVADVEAFPGHIACDGATRSELVVPVVRNGNVIALIDCDSPFLDRFDAADEDGLGQLASLMSNRI